MAYAKQPFNRPMWERLARRVHADELSSVALVLELHKAFDQSEQSIVLSAADIIARLPLRSTLTSQNIAAKDMLAAKFLKTKPLSIRVAAVSG